MSSPDHHPNPLTLSVGVQTHPGRERDENQDRITRSSSPFGDLFVLADGVGGYQGGAEAAQIVVDGYSGFLNTHGELALEQALQEATGAISAELAARLAASNARQGLGSTVVLCVVHGYRVTYAHAGDSRLYLVRDGKLTQLTRDHSVMERMISHGILTPEEAHDHPDAHALTRALGLSPEITLEVAELTVQDGDALLLCSDGLWGYAAHAEMEAIAASKSLSAAAVADALLELALQGGGGDNISIQFLRFTAVETPVLLPPRKRELGKTAFLVGAAVVLLGGGALAAFFLNQQHPSGAGAAPIRTSSTNSTTHPAAAAARRPTNRTPVTIVKTSDTTTAATWADHLSDLSYLDSHQQSGSDACLALRRSSPTLFYVPGQRSVALQAQQDLAPSAPEIAELSPEKAALCGGGNLLALPGNASPAQSMTGARNKIERGRSIDLVTGTTRELEKHMPRG